MWVIQLLPDWAFYAILIAGLVGLGATYVLRLIPIPAIYMYKTPIQLASIAAIAIGTFMSGAIFNDHAWLERVHELEVKVAVSEAESADANEALAELTAAKTEAVKERTKEIVRYIEVEKVKLDSTCTSIPPEFVFIHNKAAEQLK